MSLALKKYFYNKKNLNPFIEYNLMCSVLYDFNEDFVDNVSFKTFA